MDNQLESLIRRLARLPGLGPRSARRAALFEAVGAVGAQAWFSGTDQNDFEGLEAQPLSIMARDGVASITQSEE